MSRMVYWLRFPYLVMENIRISQDSGFSRTRVGNLVFVL